jgi:hypothetical protein
MNAGTADTQMASEEIGLRTHIRRIEHRSEWRKKPFDKESDDPNLVLTIQQHTETIQPHDTVDWIFAQDGGEQDNEEDQTQQYNELTTIIKLGEQHGASTIVLIFTRPVRTNNNSAGARKASVEGRIQQLEASGWSTLRALVKANRYGAAISTTFTMIFAMKSVHTLYTFHMQRKDVIPLIEAIDKNDRTHAEAEIQAMQRKMKKAATPMNQ